MARSPTTAAFDEDEFRNKIPKDTTPADREYYEKLIPVLRARKPSDRPRILIITDIEQDYDDLMAIIFLSEMHRLGVVELAGFIANHQQTLRRARFLRTIVYLLNLGHLEVAMGTTGVDRNMDETQYARLTGSAYYELKNETFDKMPWNDKPHVPGRKPNRQGKEPLTVLLISSMQDIGEYFKSHEGEVDFFQKHFKKFVSQGGYTHVNHPDGTCTLDPVMNMNNNLVHKPAAKIYTDCLVKYNLPSDAWSREAAKAARLEGKTLGNLSDHGPIGTHLSWLYRRQEFKFYWDPYHAPFMPHLNQGWYATTRLCLDPKSPEYARFTNPPIPRYQDVEPYSKVIAYDGCAAMGAVGDDVMEAMGIMRADAVPAYNQHRHRIFGRGRDDEGNEDPTDIGGIDGRALADTFQVFFYGALRATKDFAAQLIDPRKVEHKKEDSNTMIPLKVFKQQIPHILKLSEMKARLKDMKQQLKEMKEAGDIGEAVAAAETKRLEEEIAAYEKAEFTCPVEGVERTFPNVPPPKLYPYSLLFEEAVGKTTEGSGGG
ncbi:hypothetical protein QBC39DRAFT_266931 [Podospora conica]|nr:hypothetical protein QBC39DRAFT_266931 [Schizothecium conicum]